jgi:hypothetical protein
VKRLFLLAVTLLATGCGPYLTLVTPAPPNRSIVVRNEPDRIEISEGVAVAVNCTYGGDVCHDLHAVSSSPEIAGVYPAHIAETTWVWSGASSTTSLALVGIKPGTSTLEVSARGHTNTYQVVVLPVASVSAGSVAK